MDIQILKKLREESGAGMLECKNALNQANQNYESALKILQETNKKEQNNQRVASKGSTHLVVKDNEAVLFEVNAETDFSVKNEHFMRLIHEMGFSLIDSKARNVKEALNVQVDEVSIDEKIKRTSFIIKENVSLRRLFRIIKKSEQCFGSYIHSNGRVSTLIILSSLHQELANQLALQVAANSPLYLSPKTMDQDTINYEKFQFEKTNGSDNPQKFLTYLESISLLKQTFIKNPEFTVETLLNDKKTSVIDFFRLELGQGIENKLNCRLDIPCDGSTITIIPNQ